MNSPEQPELKIYPWSMSATGDWSKDSGLTKLAQYAHGEIPATEIAEWLWTPGIYVQNSAIVELLAHGNPKQAAVLVRALVEAHPVCKVSLENQFGPLIHEFLTTSPNRYPSQPSEYSHGTKIMYVQ